MSGIVHEVQCGAVTRLLDPANPQGTRIEIRYVVVPALARRKLPDPVFLLAGGPGQSAIDVAPQVLPVFARLLQRRDIVFVDQRGTGRSAPLACDDPARRPLAEQADPERQLAGLMQCLQRLRRLPHGDLRFYTTTLAMQDLDAVRAQLGAERINLVGASYGTRAALEYQRLFPARVRRSVLDGVTPPDMVLPDSVAQDSARALEAVFSGCEAEPTCLRAHPDLRARWAALQASVPRSVTVSHPWSGRPETFTLTRDMLLAAVRGPLYVPVFASALPEAIEQASRGRMEGLLGLNSLLAGRSGMSIATGMHFSVVCAEDAPRMSGAPVAGAVLLGGEFAGLYARACAAWPRGRVPAQFYTTRRSDSPILMLSGGLDPVTPPRHAQALALALGPQARHVLLPNAGHGVMAIGCMPDVLTRFIGAEDDAAALAVDAGCAQRVPRPPVYQPLVEAAPEAAR